MFFLYTTKECNSNKEDITSLLGVICFLLEQKIDVRR